jgi:hypothetical protein
LGKAEFVPVHRAVDESVCVQALNLDVKAGLRTKNSGLIADTMETAEHFDQSMVPPADFSYRKVIRHLLG